MTALRGGDTKKRQYLRFAWSHTSLLHRVLVRLYNRLMRLVPFSVKYGWGAFRRKKRVPYSLLGPRSVAVQVGAPRDTLHAGRSRGMYFALLAGRSIVLEPDPDGASEFERMARTHGLDGVTVVNVAAWANRSTLTLRVDPAHPATSFTDGTADYGESELTRFKTISVPARTIDDILSEFAIPRVDVLSLTTNGGEVEMLRGARQSLRDVAYVCLRNGCDDGQRFLTDAGFESYSYDDRGVTYSNSRVKPAPDQ